MYSTKLRAASITLAALFFATSCSQFEFYESPPPGSSGFEMKSSSYGTVNSEGGLFLNSIDYLQVYLSDINDPTVYDPIEYKETGIKDFSQEGKLMSRLIHFYDSLGYQVDRSMVEDVIAICESFSVDDLLRAGVNPVELRYTSDFNEILTPEAQLSDLQSVIAEVHVDLQHDISLNEDEKQRLNLAFSSAHYMIQFGLDNNLDNYGELVARLNVSDDVRCKVAVVAYAVAFVGICAATVATAGVAGVACAWIGFGASVFGVFDNC